MFNILGKMVVESIHPKNLKTTAVNMILYMNSHHHILHKHGKRNTMYKHGKRDTMYKHGKNHTKAKWITQNIWGEVVTRTSYILKMFPTKRLKKMVLKEAWLGRKSTLTQLRVFD